MTIDTLIKSEQERFEKEYRKTMNVPLYLHESSIKMVKEQIRFAVTNSVKKVLEEVENIKVNPSTKETRYFAMLDKINEILNDTNHSQ